MTQYVYTNASAALPYLCSELLRRGRDVPSRNGATKERLNTSITLTEPLQRGMWAPGRKASIAAQIVETAWVLAGRRDINAILPYLPRAADFSDDGEMWRAGYGPRLRAWGYDTPGILPIDQVRWVVDHLKASPDSRQAVIQIYDPYQDSGTISKDIPCNDWIQFIIREDKLHMHVAVRSNDLMWGWSGINTFEWSTLLEMVAFYVGVPAGTLHFSITSLHLYDRHWNRAREIMEYKEQMGDPLTPALRIPFQPADRNFEEFDSLLNQFFSVEQRIRLNPIKASTRDWVNSFPEPMLKSWLLVLLWWWSGETRHLDPLRGTALYVSAINGMANPHTSTLPIPPKEESDPLAAYRPFLDYVATLHNEKSAAYGNSWCRRGEAIGILANIARKVDRLGGAATRDETEADTAVDLFVYLAKYRTWLQEELGLPRMPWAPTGFWDSSDSSETAGANAYMRMVASEGAGRGIAGWQDVKTLENAVRERFTTLESRYHAEDPDRWETVDSLANLAFRLAYQRWNLVEEQKARTAAWHAGNSTRQWNPEGNPSQPPSSSGSVGRGGGQLWHDTMASRPDGLTILGQSGNVRIERLGGGGGGSITYGDDGPDEAGTPARV